MNSRLLLVLCLAPAALLSAADDPLRAAVGRQVEAELPALLTLYKDLHQHPELSFTEVRTGGIVAKELRALGYEVTEKVGNLGVVGVLKNGAGPTVLIRADMDALPVKELTGLPYASTAVVKDLAGNEQPAMHACGHDAHVTSLIGTARVLASLKDRWRGTVVLVAQHAEETTGGARAILMDGLYTRFPVPDYALALHVWADIPAGQVGTTEGGVCANVDAVDIVVRGVGGHGSKPHTTKDPVVLAAQIITALQTIVSRELKPGTPAVVTVGAIHGGTRRNIIGEEVKLELTLRAYNETVADQLIAAIRRISENLGRAAGLPEDRLPVVSIAAPRNPVTYNDPAFTRRVAGSIAAWIGAENVVPTEPSTVGEDFAEYGRTTHKVPICLFWVGATDPAVFAEAQKSGKGVPSNHSPLFAPLPEPTLRTGVTAMSAAALDLLAKP
jgi:hippurate hydrolase